MAKTEASKIADQLRKERYEISNFRFWGMGMFRPGDETFAILDASSEGDRLDLAFSASNDPNTRGDVMRIFQPSGLRMFPGGFEIAKAARIDWAGRDMKAPAASKEPAMWVQ